MIPALSDPAYPSGYASRQSQRSKPHEFYCEGGPDIGDANRMYGTQWKLEYRDPDFVLIREDTRAEVTLFSSPNAVSVSFAFDQAMQPVFAWRLVNDDIKLAQFVVDRFVETTVTKGTRPIVAIDIVEPRYMANSDVILSYIRDTHLYARVQREAFQTEHLLKPSAGKSIATFGRGKGFRLEWHCVPL